MSSNLHRITLIGRLGGDPEVRSTPSGKRVANASLAVTESWKNASGEKQEKTTWFRLAMWEGLASVAERYLHKGQLLFIEGTVSANVFKDKNSGESRASLEVAVRELKMLGGKNEQRSDPGDEEGLESHAERPAPAQKALPDFDDDIPFALALVPLLGMLAYTADALQRGIA